MQSFKRKDHNNVKICFETQYMSVIVLGILDTLESVRYNEIRAQRNGLKMNAWMHELKK